MGRRATHPMGGCTSRTPCHESLTAPQIIPARSGSTQRNAKWSQTCTHHPCDRRQHTQPCLRPGLTDGSSLCACGALATLGTDNVSAKAFRCVASNTLLEGLFCDNVSGRAIPTRMSGTPHSLRASSSQAGQQHNGHRRVDRTASHQDRRSPPNALGINASHIA